MKPIIDISQIEDEYLSPLHIEAAEMILARKMTGITMQEIAEKVGVTDRQLRRWRSTPAFKAYIREKDVDLVVDSRAAVLDVLTKTALEGKNAKFMELYLKVTGTMPNEKVDITAKPYDPRDTQSIEADIAELSRLLDDE